MSAVTPDPTPNMLLAAWRELTTTRASALVAAGVREEAPWGLWVFRGRAEDTVNGTNECSVVLTWVRPWAVPNRHNTARFPQLQVEVYADLTRDAENAPLLRNPYDRAEDVWKVVDPVFHRPDRKGMFWGSADGTLFVISSLRAADPRMEDIPETDGSVRLTADYNVELVG